MSKFIQNVEFNRWEYETLLPQKNNYKLLPDNFLLAKNRLVSLVNRLKRGLAVLKTYDDIIKYEEAEGIIEEPPTILKPSGEVHYLSHHFAIWPEKSTTKLRIVYDASSSIEGPSLNECVKAGLNLLPKLIDILIRFCSNKVGLISDIKQAFLNVSVEKSDRDFLRFLWVEGISSDNIKIVIRRFAGVAFGTTASQFLLAVSIHKHLLTYKNVDQNFVGKFSANLYIDDNINGEYSSGKTFELYKKVLHM